MKLEDTMADNRKISTGDILWGDFGWSMTIPVFYRVLGVTASGKSVKIARLESAVSTSDGGFSGTRVPLDTFDDLRPKAYVKRIKSCERGEYVMFNDTRLTKWDGKPKYFDSLD